MADYVAALKQALADMKIDGVDTFNVTADEHSARVRYTGSIKQPYLYAALNFDAHLNTLRPRLTALIVSKALA